jgi:galactokinase
VTRFAERLLASGMSEAEASHKARLLQLASDQLGPARAGAGGPFAVFVPGRIEVLGKHTDYAGGRSLLCAAERGICLVARPRGDGAVCVSDIVSNTRAEVSVDRDPVPPRVASRGAAARSGSDWALYIAAVARRVARNFTGALHGADIAFGSDLPMAAGMSSSSALVTSVLLALSAVNDLPATGAWRANITSREDLAEYLGTIENGQDFRALGGDGGVGTFGGSEDHTAMLCCRAGELSQYSFCPVRHERQIPMPAGYVFAVAVSGVVAEKTGAARDTYNQASLGARRVLERWNRATGRHDATLRAAVESSADAADRIRAILAETDLHARFDQFVEETFVIIPEVGDHLAAGRVGEIADLVDRSQAGAEKGLANQVPETSFLARSARELGAVAASAFGAGFGGSVWALVGASQAAEFCARWSARYAAAFPQHAGRAQFFATAAGPAALELQAPGFSPGPSERGQRC